MATFKKMTPAEFKRARRSLYPRVSQAALGRMFGMAGIHRDRTVRRWEDGERDIPFCVSYMLEWLATSKRPPLPTSAGPVQTLVRWLMLGEKPKLPGVERKTPPDSS